MPDQLDQAKELEQLHRNAALNAALSFRERRKPKVFDGITYCIDCKRADTRRATQGEAKCDAMYSMPTRV